MCMVGIRTNVLSTQNFLCNGLYEECCIDVVCVHSVNMNDFPLCDNSLKLKGWGCLHSTRIET